MLTPEQIEERKSGLGSSDIAPATGVAAYRRPIDVYAEKVGISPPFEGNDATEWGERLEPVIAQAYAEKTGTPPECIVKSNPLTVRHPEYPIALASPDRIVMGIDKPVKILECKTAGFRQLERWGAVTEELDGVPEEYIAQVQWQMLVTGIPACDLAVLIGGQDFRIYPFIADLEFQARLLDEATRFWTEHVEKRIPPPIDGSASWVEYLRNRYPRDTRPFIPADQNSMVLVAALRVAKEAREEAEKAETAIESKIKAVIADASGIDGLVTWRADKKGTRRFVLKKEGANA